MISNGWHYSCPRSVYCRYSWSLSGYLKYTDSTPSLNTRHWCYWYSPFCCVAVPRNPSPAKLVCFSCQKTIRKNQGRESCSSCQLANSLEETLKTIVCAICVVPVLKECLIVLRLKLRENQQGHPKTIFGKLSVRKTIWGLEFSDHFLKNFLLACLS